MTTQPAINRTPSETQATTEQAASRSAEGCSGFRSLATSRRQFLQVSTTAAVIGGVAGTLAAPHGVHAAGDETIKVGLIGCGGRGTGAAKDALQADPHAKLVAMADTFSDHLSSSLKRLGNMSFRDRVDVPKERQFIGFDGYKQLIDSDVDVVLLTTPPHFRPMHLEYAIKKGKHVFCEKPVAVDAPGVRKVMEASKAASQAGLSLVSGLCYRYHLGMRETVQRLNDGMIGRVLAIQSHYLTGQLWKRDRKPSWSDMEYQLRNWLYYAWLSGDHNVEQHIHSLDKAIWVLGDQPPLAALGTGGRQQRVEPVYGHIFDHHAVVYEFPNEARVFSHCRQMNGAHPDVSDKILGTEGHAEMMRQVILGKQKWRFRGRMASMYLQEHRELFESIRNGQPINNGDYMARSTMMAILGRMATYTGSRITWDQALASEEVLAPPKYDWISLPTPDVAIPGRTQFA